jgi:hypothetical protein
MITVRTTDPRALVALCCVWASVTGLALSCATEAHADGDRTFAALQSFPVHTSDRDEPEEKRRKRLREIAAAVDGATTDRPERAALLTLVLFESHAAAYVHEGRCSDGPRGALECDSGLAKGHFQLHGDVPDSLDEQAVKALSLWRFGLTRCRRAHPDPIAGAFQSFGTGGKCSPSAWSSRRADMMRRLTGKL